MTAQTGLFDEIIVDNFAGGGGASTGIELALWKIVDIAINHDPDAILMHKTNHPYTLHLQASVWDVDPIEVCMGRKVALAWFSPDCKHFSKAKGKALCDRNIRGLAWIVLRWAGTVKPRVIMLENVEEFLTWCPVRKGKPIKAKTGQTFQKWKSQLEALGYTVDYRILVAADYGAPTSRKRLVLVARCDGKEIRWPERTHAPLGSEEVQTGRCKPWRSAAEVIDWSLPCPSVFDSKSEILKKYDLTAVRPLAENTMKRVIRGVDKFTIKSGKPFIVPTGYGERSGQAPRTHDVDNPLPTVVGTNKQNVCCPVLVECNHSGGGHINSVEEPCKTITAKHTAGVCETMLAPFIAQQKFDNAPQSINEPLSTITSVGSHELVAANLIQYHTEQTENVRANGVEVPVQTVDASNRYALTTANLVEYFSTGRPLPVDEPMHTATTRDREALTVTHIVKFKGKDKGQHPEQPLQTVTTSAGEFAVCGVTIVKYQQGAALGRWAEIRELLNLHCGYSLAEDELLLLRIYGHWYFIADIGLRMLTPRELYNAMGFPQDYQIDRDYLGNAYGKSKQVARCGNAVCPPMATAVVRANLPDMASKVDIQTMRQLLQQVAV